MLVSQLLAIATQLAVLTYYTGVLVYMLPIPLKRLKKLAPHLMVDGLYAALLIGLFSTLLYVSDYIGSLSGYTLTDVLVTTQMYFRGILELYYMKKMYELVLSGIPIGRPSLAISIIFIPLMVVYTFIVSASLSLLSVVLSIINLKAELMALGVALYAIPLRLARSAGASLIAFALVVNAALPFFPHWMKMILSSVGLTEKELFWENQTLTTYPTPSIHPFWGRVTDGLGDAPKYAVVAVENSTTVILYQTNRQGYYAASNPAPSTGTYDIYVDYMGLRITEPPMIQVRVPADLEPTYEATILPYRFDIKFSRNVKFLEPQAVLWTNCAMDNAELYMALDGDRIVYSNVLECRFMISPELHAVMSIPSVCRLRSFLILPASVGAVTRASLEQRDWHGLQVDVYNIVGQVNLTLLEGSGGFMLRVDYDCPKSYVPYQPLGVSSLEPDMLYAQVTDELEKSVTKIDMINIIPFGIAFSLSVFSFLTIVMLIVRDTARLIGAYSPSIVIEPLR